MRTFFSAIFAVPVFLAAVTAQAKDVVVKRTWEVGKPATAVIEALAAYDQYCARGCKYHVPSVATAQILAYAHHPDDFYTWTFAKDVQDSSWFSHVTVKRAGPRSTVTVRMVAPALGATLEKSTKHPHDPAVDDSQNVYELESLAAEKTRVTLTETISISGVSALLGSGIVRDRLEEAARAMQGNLTRPPR